MTTSISNAPLHVASTAARQSVRPRLPLVVLLVVATALIVLALAVTMGERVSTSAVTPVCEDWMTSCLA